MENHSRYANHDKISKQRNSVHLLKKNSHTFPFHGTIEELNLVVRLNFSPSKKNRRRHSVCRICISALFNNFLHSNRGHNLPNKIQRKAGSVFERCPLFVFSTLTQFAE